MRVGVVADRVQPEAGGVFTFIDAIIDAIKKCAGSHEFVIWEPVLGPIRRWRWRETVKRAGDRVGGRRFIRFTAGQMRSLKAVFATRGISPVERFISESNVDVVWFLSQTDSPVSVPYLTTVWDLQHRRQPFFPEVSTTGWTWDARETAFRSSLPRASRIITSTQAGKDEIVAFYGICAENVVVVPMPVAEDELIENSDSHIDVKAKYNLQAEFLFYPAQFWPHKNHVNLLLALDHLKKNAGVELDLVLTGSDKGNLKHVCETVTGLGLTSQVHNLGFVPKADLHWLYREACSLVFPSFFGPDNIPPLEAFALGCPVLAARVPGSEEQLGDAALFFDPADPADIAGAILTVHRDRRLRGELINRGRAVVSARSSRAYVEQICCVLDDFSAIRRCWGRHYEHK